MNENAPLAKIEESTIKPREDDGAISPNDEKMFLNTLVEEMGPRTSMKKSILDTLKLEEVQECARIKESESKNVMSSHFSGSKAELVSNSKKSL